MAYIVRIPAKVVLTFNLNTDSNHLNNNRNYHAVPEAVVLKSLSYREAWEMVGSLLKSHKVKSDVDLSNVFL